MIFIPTRTEIVKERKSNRLQSYDYSSDNTYFVTAKVKHNICCFGEISEGTDRDLSANSINPNNNPVGTGRDLSLRNLNPKRMILNEYGIIAEHQWYWMADQYPYVILHEFIVMPDHIHGIIQINHDLSKSQIKIKSLSELMGAYKTTVSKKIHHAGNRWFAWQRSFYERIIRDEKEFQNISGYIRTNPFRHM
jgi:REP element-mobilizing transposase RayT